MVEPHTVAADGDQVGRFDIGFDESHLERAALFDDLGRSRNPYEAVGPGECGDTARSRSERVGGQTVRAIHEIHE